MVIIKLMGINMNKILIILVAILIMIGCTTNNQSLDTGVSNTKISGHAVMYSQRTF